MTNNYSDRDRLGIEIGRLIAEVERLTKERYEARSMADRADQRAERFRLDSVTQTKPAPHPGDEELRNVAECLRETPHNLGSHEISSLSLRDYLDTMEQLVLLLAKRALGES